MVCTGGEQEHGALHVDGLVVVGPVGGRRDGVLGRQLERLDAAADLVHVAPNGGRVVQSLCSNSSIMLPSP